MKLRLPRQFSTIAAIALVAIATVACGTSTTTPSATTGGPTSSGASPSSAATTSASAPTSDNPVPVTFQLNFTAGGYNAGFALALQKGYYKDVGLDVTIVKGQGSGTTTQLVASGQAGLAYADALTVMQYIAKGAPIKILSTIYQSNPNAVEALKESGISKFTDLKGKKIGAPTGQSQTAMIPILFEANGMSVDDVTLVNMPGNAMVAALLQHQVDAILGSLDNYSLILKDQGAEIVEFPFADYGVATVSTSVIASNSFLEQQGDAIVKGFVAASLKGWNDAIEDPDAAIEALVKTFPNATDPELNRGQLDAAISLMCANGAKFVGKAEPEAWEQSTKIAQQVLGLPESAKATDFYTYDYLPSTLPTSCPLS